MNNYIINKPAILSLISIFFITACGGGSSADTSEKTVTNYTFELTASIANACDVKSPFTDVELLVQDDDWQITERYSADANGVISFTSQSEYINYTLVAKSQQGDDVEGLDIKSFYQAVTASSNVYTATYDTLVNDETCQCITSNLVLNHRTLNTRRDYFSSLPYESTEDIDSSTTQFNNVEVCRESTENWPLASFMVTGESSTQSLIGAANFLASFTADENWLLSAIEIPEEITLAANESLAFTSSQLIDHNEHFLINVEIDDESLLVFNSHQYLSEAFYKFYAEQTLAATSTLFSQSSLLSTNKILSTSYDDAYNTEVSVVELDKLDIDYTNFSELSADGRFDYSAINNHPMAIIKFTYSVLASTGGYYPVTWTNYNENEGVLASAVALTGYQDLVNEETTIIESSDVTLLRSFNSSDYYDYIGFFQQGGSLNNDEDITDEFSHNLHFYQVKHKLR